jgi:hypothetical protein
VVREGEKWRLRWGRAERIALLLARHKRVTWKALAQLRAEVEGMGAGRALEQAGVRPGDIVLVDGVEMEW